MYHGTVVPGGDPHLERLQVEQVLREKLDCARADYEASKQEVSRLTEIRHDVGPGNLDGLHGFRHALADETSALTRYKTALAEFTQFLLNGTVPPSVR